MSKIFLINAYKLVIIRTMRDFEPYYTEDGSIGLYSYADKDVFHSKFGALTEAWEKFVIPAGLTGEENNLKVLDVCYGIGYNTKALMSFFINKNKRKLKKKNFLKKIFEKFFIKPYNTVSKYTNNTILKNKRLSLPIVSIENDKNLPSLKIDCLEINKELIELSPFFRTVKTPGEIYETFVPKILNCFDSYYKIESLFENLMSNFTPKNRKEIRDLLEIKFKNMHIDKEYKVNGFVNYILINNMSENFGVEYPDDNIKKIIKEKRFRRFFDKSLFKYAKFNQFWGYNSSSKHSLSAFLHNIYYCHLSYRNKNINFKTAQSLFNLNFYVDDARKTILNLNEEYDCIFLDAFTYTKAPQLWSYEFIAELYKRISPTGLLLTYSNSVQVRNTLIENGFFVGKIYDSKNNKFIGTIASKDKTKILYPLTNYELGLCATKAGIPYHDPNLAFDSKDILELREYEYRHSNLMSSSKYIKIRSMKDDEI